MKRLCLLVLSVLFLVGCTSSGKEMDKVLSLRQAVLKGNGCAFEAMITADYGDRLYTFTMNCVTDTAGNLKFEVLTPNSISGITGIVTEEDGKLTFDDKTLLFETIADEQITPVSAPWLFIHTLRSGYISACGTDGEGLHIQIDDSYADNALQMDIWTNESILPVRAEIVWSGRRILSIDVKEFVIL